ncbi:type VI secretion system Vgr family protein [Neoroseomonas oryzicola]|uniref:Type VI secretion system tip protein VgrG n=1 Tax=Neoroseomonas oryzicola TaxID=535904 RepID=A0A9X9WJ48_9PROT|nr:type VI secretion system tip protein TssI/VgrG [Neoroseomonas oryzicola]MBR0660358.1 type VI secretion system tip protein VgrG [Neoroseomonas oryzicola]NKE18354.1 type VI secretion system tip protein VgrG [Neoroseomonas oryzicola]
MSGSTNTTRLLDMQVTALGSSVIVPYDLVGEDAISKPFVFTVRFATDAAIADVAKQLGGEVTVWFGEPEASATIADPSVARRPLHGHFRSLSRIGRRPNNASTTALFDWEAEIVPKVWFLSQTSDFRIFQDMTVPAIVQQVLADHGITSSTVATTGSYGTLEYCVQYGETALDFISRLMEQAGLYYWHEHTDTTHTLVIKDIKSGARVPSPSLGTLAVGGGGKLTSIAQRYAFRTGKWHARDYNLLNPTSAYEGDSEWADSYGASNNTGVPTEVTTRLKDRERYRYPALPLARVHNSSTGTSYVTSTDVRGVSDLLMEVEEANFQRWAGRGAASQLDAGTKVAIDPEDDATTSVDFVVTRISHQCSDYSYWADQTASPVYTNAFECIPYAVQFRPDRVTPKPAVQGPQTAIVVGASGDTAGNVRTDNYGRVKVQFAWDRASYSSPDASSCWVRVSQAWAGGRWGHFFIPRVGDEVIVDFLEGDPDRPIITGRVHHTSNMPPLLGSGGGSDISATTPLSGIRTRSTPGGTADNYNELSFNDSIGSEQVLLHAEKDYIVEVENNETRTVGMGTKTGNRTTTIKTDETISVGGNKSTTVTGNVTEAISGRETRTVTGNVTETFSANETRTVTGDFTEAVTGKYSVTTSSSMTLTAATSITFNAPQVLQTGPYWFVTGGYSGTAYGFTASVVGVSTSFTGASALSAATTAFNTGVVSGNTVAIQMNAGAISLENKKIGLAAGLIDLQKKAVKVNKKEVKIDSAGAILIT